MRVRSSDAYGSFVAWGVGFCYEYDSDSEHLTIIHVRSHKPLIDIDISEAAFDSPMDFVEFFEKTTQIQALMSSNNTTYDMCEIFSRKQLRPYLENTVAIAAKAISLQIEDYKAFDSLFCERYSLKSLIVIKEYYGVQKTPFFSVTLETHKGNKISAQAYFLHNCFYTLSRQIISDLVFLETGHNFHPAALRLLRASSKLSILSFLLNKNFVPRRKIMQDDLLHPLGEQESFIENQ